MRETGEMGEGERDGKSSSRVQLDFCVDAEFYKDGEFCVDIKSMMLKKHIQYFHVLD